MQLCILSDKLSLVPAVLANVKAFKKECRSHLDMVELQPDYEELVKLFNDQFSLGHG